MPLIDLPNEHTNEKSGLVGWVLSYVTVWEQNRDNNYKDRWEEYYRLWRGVWAEEDKTRKSERSRFIAPALQQAIEAAVAEQEEAVFGRERWVDISDDNQDTTPGDTVLALEQIIEDFKIANVPGVCSEVFLNGALYGTGIAKILIEPYVIRTAVPSDIEGIEPEFVKETTLLVKMVPIDPREFVIDPVAKDIDGGLGCAHVTLVPLHSIVTKQKSGVYKGEIVSDYTPDGSYSRAGEKGLSYVRGMCKITEYHGLVPKVYMSESSSEDADMTDMVEAIITIANDSILLRAIKNPYTMKDRSFVAYPHEKVPNRFWGRGVAEKGYNPQKQLDAELRARIDALAFSVHPMIGIDASRLPRGDAFEVRPGRTILTTGNPSEILQPLQFPPPDAQTYRQAADMERMIQMGTGSMDSAVGSTVNPRNATASGMSMMLAGSLKRSKRTMQNIERNFLRPFVQKALWRYMQYVPERYPAKDYQFTVRASLGIMAREVEQQLLVSLASTTPPGTPAYWVILKAIFETSTIAVKAQVLQALEETQNTPPPEPPPDLNSQANMARVQLEGEIFKHTQEMDIEKLRIEYRKLDQRDTDLTSESISAQAEAARDQAESIKFSADAQLAATKAQVAQLSMEIEGFKVQKAAEAAAKRNEIKEMELFNKAMDTRLKDLEERNKEAIEANKAQVLDITSDMAEVAADKVKLKDKS